MNTDNSYEKIIKELNKKLKAKENYSDAAVNEQFQKFLNKFVYPQGCFDWEMSLDLELKQYQICVLAHSKNPERCLAMIDFVPKTKKVANPKLKYIFRKITFTAADKDSIRLEPESKTCACLYTEKRGFWFVLNTKTSPLIVDVYNCKDHRDLLYAMYKKYVHGMENEPANLQLIVTGYEQFDIKNYPTVEWKQSTEWKKKVDSENVIVKRKSKHQKISKSNDDESTSKAPPPPPVKAEMTDEYFGIKLDIPPYVHENPRTAPFEPSTIDSDAFLESIVADNKLMEALDALTEMDVLKENNDALIIV
jgi:hypothetical protein